jgi:hypothetical protein
MGIGRGSYGVNGFVNGDVLIMFDMMRESSVA